MNQAASAWMRKGRPSWSSRYRPSAETRNGKEGRGSGAGDSPSPEAVTSIDAATVRAPSKLVAITWQVGGEGTRGGAVQTPSCVTTPQPLGSRIHQATADRPASTPAWKATRPPAATRPVAGRTETPTARASGAARQAVASAISAVAPSRPGFTVTPRTHRTSTILAWLGSAPPRRVRDDDGPSGQRDHARPQRGRVPGGVHRERPE